MTNQERIETEIKVLNAEYDQLVEIIGFIKAGDSLETLEAKLRAIKRFRAEDLGAYGEIRFKEALERLTEDERAKHEEIERLEGVYLPVMPPADYFEGVN
jgi:hypothetical protein